MVKFAHWTLGMIAVRLALTQTLVGAQTNPPPSKPTTPTNVPAPVVMTNVLELMQIQVATVAGKARLCVVSIEDARALVVDFNVSPLRKTELEEQIAHLEIDKKAMDTEAVRAKLQYQAGTLTLADSQRPLREQTRIDTRLTYLRQRLANFGREDALTQQKHEADEHIVELEGDLKHLTQRVSFAQEQVQAGVAPVGDLEEAKRQQAHVQLDLNNARQQKEMLSHVQQNNVVLQYNTQSGMAGVHPVAPKSGSGFCIGEGYIVTTADVVQGMNTPIVTVDDGRRMRATLVALDVERNIGLVRLTANANVPGLTMGDSDSVQPGHFAICIGNQSGQFNSVALSTVSGIRTQGVYSGTHFYPYLLQIDGTVGAGTSGAPVLNARGEVIGMIAAVLASEPSSAGNNYNNINYSGAPGANNAFYSLPPPGIPPTPAGVPGGAGGVFIAPGGQPASQSAVPTGAQRAVFGGTNTNTTGQQMPAGQQKTTTVRRGEKQTGDTVKPEPQNTAVRTGAANSQARGENGASDAADRRTRAANIVTAPVPAPQTQRGGGVGQAIPAAPSVRSFALSANSSFAIPANDLKVVVNELKAGKNIVHPWLGMALDDIDNAREENGVISLNRQVRLRGLYANSPAFKAGAQTGDVLLRLNDKPMPTSSDVRAAILALKAGQKVALVVLRDGKPLTLTITLETQPTLLPTLLTGNVLPPQRGQRSGEKPGEPIAPGK